MRRLLVLLAALAVGLTLPGLAAGYKNYTRLNDVASWLAQRPVQVRCLSDWESRHDLIIAYWGAAAYVDIVYDAELERERPDDFAVFSYPLCETLLRPQNYNDVDFAWAVLVITHESGHLRGTEFPKWRSEANVNCWAARRASAVAILRFGWPETRRAEFDSMIWGLYRHQPAEYQKPNCAP